MNSVHQGIAALNGKLFTASALENRTQLLRHELFRGRRHALDIESKVCDSIADDLICITGPVKVTMLDLGISAVAMAYVAGQFMHLRIYDDHGAMFSQQQHRLPEHVPQDIALLDGPTVVCQYSNRVVLTSFVETRPQQEVIQWDDTISLRGLKSIAVQDVYMCMLKFQRADTFEDDYSLRFLLLEGFGRSSSETLDVTPTLEPVDDEFVTSSIPLFQSSIISRVSGRIRDFTTVVGAHNSTTVAVDPNDIHVIDLARVAGSSKHAIAIPSIHTITFLHWRDGKRLMCSSASSSDDTECLHFLEFGTAKTLHKVYGKVSVAVGDLMHTGCDVVCMISGNTLLLLDGVDSWMGSLLVPLSIEAPPLMNTIAHTRLAQPLSCRLSDQVQTPVADSIPVDSTQQRTKKRHTSTESGAAKRARQDSKRTDGAQERDAPCLSRSEKPIKRHKRRLLPPNAKGDNLPWSENTTTQQELLTALKNRLSQSYLQLHTTSDTYQKKAAIIWALRSELLARLTPVIWEIPFLHQWKLFTGTCGGVRPVAGDVSVIQAAVLHDSSHTEHCSASSNAGGVQILNVHSFVLPDTSHNCLIVRVINRGQAVRDVTIRCSVRGATMTSVSGYCPLLAENEETCIACFHDRQGVNRLYRRQFQPRALITDAPMQAAVFNRHSGFIVYEPTTYLRLQPVEVSVQWDVETGEFSEPVLGYSGGYVIDTGRTIGTQAAGTAMAPYPLAAFRCWELVTAVDSCTRSLHSPFNVQDFYLATKSTGADVFAVTNEVHRRLQSIAGVQLHRLSPPHSRPQVSAEDDDFELDFDSLAGSVIAKSIRSQTEIHLVLDEIDAGACILRMLSLTPSGLQDLPQFLRSKLPADLDMDPDYNSVFTIQLIREALAALISEFHVEAIITHHGLPQATKAILEGKLPANPSKGDMTPGSSVDLETLIGESICRQLRTDQAISALLHVALELIPESAQLFRA